MCLHVSTLAAESLIFGLFQFQGLVSGLKTSKKISVFFGPLSEIGTVRLRGLMEVTVFGELCGIAL